VKKFESNRSKTWESKKSNLVLIVDILRDLRTVPIAIHLIGKNSRNALRGVRRDQLPDADKTGQTNQKETRKMTTFGQLKNGDGFAVVGITGQPRAIKISETDAFFLTGRKTLQSVQEVDADEPVVSVGRVALRADGTTYKY